MPRAPVTVEHGVLGISIVWFAPPRCRRACHYESFVPQELSYFDEGMQVDAHDLARAEARIETGGRSDQRRWRSWRTSTRWSSPSTMPPVRACHLVLPMGQFIAVDKGDLAHLSRRRLGRTRRPRRRGNPSELSGRKAGMLGTLESQARRPRRPLRAQCAS